MRKGRTSKRRRRKGTYSGREYVGRVNYKCVEGASENARSREMRTRTKAKKKDGDGFGRSAFSADARDGDGSPAFARILPLAARRIFIPMRTTDGRTDGTEQLHPRRRRRPRRRPPPLPPSSVLPFPLQRPILRARANKRDSRPFISLRVNSLNRAGVAQ